MSSILRRWGVGALACTGMLLGSMASALAGSDNSSNTYAGDVNGLALPTGTFLAIDYLGYRHGDFYVTSNSNIFSKLSGGQREINSNVELFTNITRFSYFSQLGGHPLVFEAAVPFVNVNDANIGNLPRPLGGLGPQTKADGVLDPVLFVTYGVINEPRMERFLGVTNYFYLPAGRRYIPQSKLTHRRRTNLPGSRRLPMLKVSRNSV